MTEVIAVTGASGFVGQRLLASLHDHGFTPRALLRRETPLPAYVQCHIVGDLAQAQSLAESLTGVSAVIHLAAHTHSGDPADARAAGDYRRVNVDGTRRVAEAAIKAGVARFVFLSSIKVNGEQTAAQGHAKTRYSPRSTPAPEDHYGQTKYEAEQLLDRLLRSEPASLCVLRPPLVYGPGNKGNLLKLTRWVSRAYPLPFAGIRNARSLIHVDNLVDALVLSIQQRHVEGVFTLADVDLSTPQLIEAIANGLGTRAKLFHVPRALLGTAAALCGRRQQWSRLSESLLVDSSAIRRQLGWQPRHSLHEGMSALAQWYRGTHR